MININLPYQTSDDEVVNQLIGALSQLVTQINLMLANIEPDTEIYLTRKKADELYVPK